MPTPAATPAAGTPVPAYPTCRVPRCVSFTAGFRNGEDHGEGKIDALVRNFKRFAADGYWRPYGSVDHEEHPDWAGLSVGDVTDAWKETVDGRPALVLALDNVPVPIGRLINGGQLRARSVEWFEPPNAFVGPDDEPVPEPVLKSVSFLGSKSEAAKGMPPAQAVFADAYRPAPAPVKNPSTPALKFESAVMDRAAMIQALTDAGFDTSKIADDTPDELVQAIYAAVVGEVTDDPPAPTDPAPVQMNQAGAAVTVPAVGGGTGAGQQPTSLTVKFADKQSAAAFGTLWGGLLGEVNSLKGQLGRQSQDADRRRRAEKAGKVKRFLDEVQGGKEPKIVQAQRPALEALLLGCDDDAVRKFADGKADGTALDEQMALIRSWPPARTFGEKLADPVRGPLGTGSGGAASSALKGMREVGERIAARRATAAAN